VNTTYHNQHIRSASAMKGKPASYCGLVVEVLETLDHYSWVRFRQNEFVVETSDLQPANYGITEEGAVWLLDGIGPRLLGHIACLLNDHKRLPTFSGRQIQEGWTLNSIPTYYPPSLQREKSKKGPATEFYYAPPTIYDLRDLQDILKMESPAA
jgi:hypothetical protein